MTKTSGQLELERRREKSQIVIEDLATCYFCKSTGLMESDKYCPNCAFPQRGTQLEMKKFIWNVDHKEILLNDKKKAVSKARNVLYILGGLNLLIGLVAGLLISVNISFLLGGLIGSGIYFSLGFWSKTQPFAAILSGFFVYIVFIVLNAIIDPNTLYHGIFWKVIIISSFIYGYKGVLDSKRLEKELESTRIGKDLNVKN